MSRDAGYRGRKGFFNHKHDKKDQWSRGPDYLGADTPNWRSPVPEPFVGTVTTQAVSTVHQDYAEFLHKGWNDFKLEKSAEGSSVKVHQEEAAPPSNPPIKLEEWIRKQSVNTEVAN